MIQSNFQEFNYFENLPVFHPNFCLNQTNLQQNQFCPNYYTPPLQEFSPNSSDEAEDLKPRVIDERKQRRMISNRESARRSRMRKQRHLDELWSQVLRLRTENHSLVEKLNQVSESYERVVQENARIKEEASELRQMLTEMNMANSFAIFRDVDDVITCNTAHLRAESSSNQSVTTSTNLLL